MIDGTGRVAALMGRRTPNDEPTSEGRDVTGACHQNTGEPLFHSGITDELA
jgi:hypothetical protein